MSFTPVPLNQLPDRAALAHLREQLWRGRASVMVGAGFSRNAVSVVANKSKPPLWNAIVQEMASRLGRADNETWPATQPDIAAQYEAVFGRQALDEFIFQQIADADFRPGEIHRLLLSLPWADIFSTNFDTLLERASQDVLGRSFSLVTNSGDLSVTSAPRIVKLHGSFPSQRPWILTTNDFRTYPRLHAPFVNFVRQSVMENTFCLIGFSGDDPNWLAWSGWVSDELGNAMPPIYLVGLLDLDAGKRRLLEARHFTPIDLGAAFRKSGLRDDDERHSKAIHWLLYELLLGKRAESRDWPHLERHLSFHPPPEVALEDIKLKTHEMPNRPQNGYGEAELLKLTDVWRSQREAYPGWILAPSDRRKQLEYGNLFASGDLFRSSVSLKQPQDILFLRELVWNYEVSLLVISPDEFEHIAAVVDRYKAAEINQNAIAEAFADVCQTTARLARIVDARKYAQKFLDAFRSIASSRDEWQSALIWAEIESLLATQQFSQAMSLVDTWSPNSSRDRIRRTAALIDLGRFRDAENEARNAISEIRRAAANRPTNAYLASQEVIAMYLLEHSISWDFARAHAERDGVKERLDDLESWFHGFNEIAEFNFRVVLESVVTPEEPVGGAFDPGYVKTGRSKTFKSRDEQLIEALRPLIASETAALPLSMLARYGKTDPAAPWIASALARLSLSLSIDFLLRSNPSKLENIIDIVFDRITVGLLPEEEAGILIERLKSAVAFLFATSLDSRYRAPRPTRLSSLAAGIEILSRLTFRMNYKQMEETLALAQQIAERSDTEIAFSIDKQLAHLFHRLIDVWPKAELPELTKRLLTAPIYSERTPALGHSHCADPITQLFNREFPELGSTWKSEQQPTVVRLIATLATSDHFERECALQRIAVSHRLGIVSESVGAVLAEAIWNTKDPNTGLPTNMFPLRLAYILELPHPAGINPRELLLESIVHTKPPNDFTVSTGPDGRRMISRPMPAESALRQILVTASSLEFSSNQAEQLLQTVKEWWEGEKPGLGTSSSPFAPMFVDPGEAVRDAIQLLARHLIPKMLSEAAINEVIPILADMDAKGFIVVGAHISLLRHRPQEIEQVLSKLRALMASADEEKFEAAMNAVLWWCKVSGTLTMPTPPQDLLREIVRHVILRRPPTWFPAMRTMCFLIENRNYELLEDDLQSLGMSYDHMRSELDYEGNSLLAKNELPRYRVAATQLAREIAECVRKDPHRSVPDAINKWLSTALNDMLPEVRAAATE